MTENLPTTLMTGATGFLGNFLLRDLLARGGRRIVATLRAPVEKSGRRLHEAMLKLGVDLAPHIKEGRLTLVEGALPDRLPEPTWGRTDEILSNAATLKLFANGDGEPFKTNVEGIEALIAWARRHGVSRVHAVSTAYACGSYTDVREVFHHPPPTFKTDYEKSKWLAESLWEKWGTEPGHTLTVYRPSFLIGDSETGYTTQFGGFYQLARAISLMKDHYSEGKNGSSSTYVPLRIPGRPADLQNFVPVDFASRIITEVMLDPARHGRIYNLTDPCPPNNDHIKRCLEEYFRLHGGYFVEPEALNGDRSPAESLLTEKYDVVSQRFMHNPRFHQDNTEAVMKALGILFPALDRTRFFRLLDFAVSRRWGQRSNGSSH